MKSMDNVEEKQPLVYKSRQENNIDPVLESSKTKNPPQTEQNDFLKYSSKNIKNNFVRKVYGILLAQIIVTSVFVILSVEVKGV